MVTNQTTGQDCFCMQENVFPQIAPGKLAFAVNVCIKTNIVVLKAIPLNTTNMFWSKKEQL